MSDVALEGFGGGGGASLNFKVKDYATEELLMAATGKDNEIGIITSTPMTGWYFAAEQPGNMQPGEVWISTGTSSTVAFNAAKKGVVMVYPISAKQMQEDGALVDVTAKSWQNGAWVGWISDGYLFYSGAGERVPFTLKKESSAIVTITNDYVQFDRSALSSSQASYYVQKSFDGYNWLKARVHETAQGERSDLTAALAYSTGVPGAGRNQYTRTAEVVFSVTGEAKVYELNISAQSGTFYVAITGGMIGKIYDIWLEK